MMLCYPIYSTSTKHKSFFSPQQDMKFLPGLIAGVVIVFIVYSFLSGGFSLTGSSVADSTDPCDALEGTAKDDCYFEARKCSKMSVSPLRDTCIAELAEAKGDVAICDLIADKKAQGFCIEQIAELQNDPALCNRIGDQYWADNCNSQLATKNNEARYCYYVINDAQRQDCLQEIAVVTNNAELCEDLDEEARGACIYTVAANTKNVDLCSRLNEPINRDACRYKVARDSANKALCSEIKIRDIRVTCEEYFTGSA